MVILVRVVRAVLVVLVVAVVLLVSLVPMVRVVVVVFVVVLVLLIFVIVFVLTLVVVLLVVLAQCVGDASPFLRAGGPGAPPPHSAASRVSAAGRPPNLEGSGPLALSATARTRASSAQKR